MKVYEIAEKLNFKLLAGEAGIDREVVGLYTCDLLSWVIGRAQEDNMWFTVMGNINAIAVASLGDVSCIVLTDNASLDEEARQRAEQNEIPVYQTEMNTAQALIATHELLK